MPVNIQAGPRPYSTDFQPVIAPCLPAGTGHLLDTNVVSELRKVIAGRADQHVAAWQEQVNKNACFVSAVTLMELEIGVLCMERRDGRQGALLRAWLEEHVVPEFAGRILAGERCRCTAVRPISCD